MLKTTKMKKLINAIVRFFKRLWNSLFGKKVQEVSVPVTNPYPDQPVWTNRPQRRSHNNRRITRGRFVQYVPLPNGNTRPIYHTAKN